MFVLLFPDKSDVSSRHLLLMHQSTARRRTDVGGKIPSQTLRRSLYKPKCRIGLPPGSPEKLAWMFTSSPPPPPKKKDIDGRSEHCWHSLGHPTAGREHSDLQDKRDLHSARQEAPAPASSFPPWYQGASGLRGATHGSPC